MACLSENQGNLFSDAFQNTGFLHPIKKMITIAFVLELVHSVPEFLPSFLLWVGFVIFNNLLSYANCFSITSHLGIGCC